ncbi:MAG TPA: hypothetical protein ENK91_08170 [Bacteroidetes bacterium]|nr:hypothetical protein [Bacteroidota bacterium]
MYKNRDKLRSNNVADWVKVQDKYYNVLEKLGRANVNSGEKITDEYDKLCSAKLDVDFKIAEYYYNEGLEKLAEYDSTKLKVYARDAFYSFNNSIEKGGPGYFNDIESLIEFCKEKGVVYYECYDMYLGSSLFFQPIPDDADFQPDCIVDVDQTIVGFYEDEDKDEKEYSKEIETGTKETIDTSGNVIVKPVYETIEATVTIITHTLTAYRTTTIDVDDMTGQCTMSSESFTTRISDSYEEIKIEGDRNAIDDGTIEKTGEPAFFRSNLEDELEDKIEERLNSF